MRQLEKKLESWSVKYIKKHYWNDYSATLLKFASPNKRGYPDRILLAKKAIICFIEFKAPGKLPAPIQDERIKYLKSIGFAVYVCDNKEQFIDICKKHFT